MVINVGHPEDQERLEQVLSATMGDVFAHVVRDPIEPTNTLLVASDRAAVAARGCARRRRRCRSSCGRWRCGRRRASAPPLPGGEVYTDDDAPVEWLIDRSIVEYAEDD